MAASKPLFGKVALVTGATRGIGKGIALQLGEDGALVYITGRTFKSGNTETFGSLEDTATEIRNRGGSCIPVQVDHENDKEVANLFHQIETEQNGNLDILVNNAFKAVNVVFENISKKFWETSPELWDEINNVGLRNHYICSVYAARLMVPRKQGLIVNISSPGGMHYLFNVPYGVGKAGLDRMAIDCGIELKKSNITCLSLYPGPVRTELVTSITNKMDESDQLKEFFRKGESIEFSGKIVSHMAKNSRIHKYTSRVVIGADYAQEHGIRDIDDRIIPSIRQVNYYGYRFILPENYKYIANYIPGFIKIPYFAITLFNSKF